MLRCRDFCFIKCSFAWLRPLVRKGRRCHFRTRLANSPLFSVFFVIHVGTNHGPWGSDWLSQLQDKGYWIWHLWIPLAPKNFSELQFVLMIFRPFAVSKSWSFFVWGTRLGVSRRLAAAHGSRAEAAAKGTFPGEALDCLPVPNGETCEPQRPLHVFPQNCGTYSENTDFHRQLWSKWGNLSFVP